MALRWCSNVVESTDPGRLARWWGEALDRQIAYEADDEVVLITEHAHELAPKPSFEQVPPGLTSVLVDHEKQAKGRIRMDLARRTSDDRDAEIARLEAIGAVRIEVGQGPDVSWAVLADIDGNESCVLSSREQ